MRLKSDSALVKATLLFSSGLTAIAADQLAGILMLGMAAIAGTTT